MLLTCNIQINSSHLSFTLSLFLEISNIKNPINLRYSVQNLAQHSLYIYIQFLIFHKQVNIGSYTSNHLILQLFYLACCIMDYV